MMIQVLIQVFFYLITRTLQGRRWIWGGRAEKGGQINVIWRTAFENTNVLTLRVSFPVADFHFLAVIMYATVFLEGKFLQNFQFDLIFIQTDKQRNRVLLWKTINKTGQRLGTFGEQRVHPDLQYRNISVGPLDLLRLKTEPHRNTEERRDAHVPEPGAFKREKIYQNTKCIGSLTNKAGTKWSFCRSRHLYSKDIEEPSFYFTDATMYKNKYIEHFILYKF